MYDEHRHRNNRRRSSLERELAAIEECRKEQELDFKLRVKDVFDENFYNKFLKILNKVSKGS